MSEPNPRVVIRRFDAARDAAALRQCIADQQDFHRGLEPSWPEGGAIATPYMSYLEAECAAHNGRIFMAQQGEQAAGFVCVIATTRAEAPDDPQPFAWIQDLYVRPEHRRRGIASLLMAEAERFARDAGAQVLRLGVLARNEGARAFYTRHAFREYTHILTKPLG
jgi:ribosomal protein S18 acetylase RimI-like enzyme